jgi:hypothetical protein
MHLLRDLSKNGCNGFVSPSMSVEKVIGVTAIKNVGGEFGVGSTVRDATLTRFLQI